MANSYTDPRNIAYVLDVEALKAGCAGRATVTLSTEVAHRIAEHLRRAPLKRGRAPLSLMDRNHRRALATKARRLKDELRAKGKSAMEAEAEAAELMADGCGTETFRREMQNRTDDK